MNASLFVFNVSKTLRRFPFVYYSLRRIYCVFFPGLRFCIEQTFRDFDEVFVLKIGANDGIKSDPLASFLLNDRRYRGLFVEPIPTYAKALWANYETTGRFKIEQVAIAAEDSKKAMYYVDEQAVDSEGRPLAEWLRGVASLDRAHVEKHLPPDMHKFVKETTVDCLSIASVLERNKIQKVDLLQIDTEGYDYVVLQQFDFSVVKPKLVVFERKHLTKEAELASKKFMEDAGYSVKILETDFLCITH
jgi:FkbM family methyltransferase